MGLFKKKDEKTDFELITNYRYSGDTRYVGLLFQRYVHLITSLSLKYLKNKVEAEDAVMEIFEIILKDLRKHDVKNFSAWVYSVTKNHCIKTKQNTPSTEDLEEDKTFFSQNIVEKSTNDTLYIKEQEESLLISLEKGLHSLNEEQKKCLELFYLKNKSYVQIVEETGYSENQVKSFIQNGKRNLKIYLSVNERRNIE